MKPMQCVWPLMLLLLSATVSAHPQTRPDQTPGVGASGTALADNWVTLQIHARFIPEAALENSDIDVETNRGAVTLHGTVATRAARERAAAIAQATDGVTSVRDNLRVGGGGAGGRLQDGWLKARIAAQLVAEDALENSDIDIDVGRGAVTLVGTVSTEAARARAESLVKATDGVKNVRNNLKVSAPAR